MTRTLRLSGVRHRYPDAPTEALAGIDARVEPGRRVAVVGRLGSGRSTLLRAMCGVVPSLIGGRFSGEVTYGTARLDEHPVSTIAEYIALVLQDPEAQLLSRSVGEDVAMGPRSRGLPVDEVRQRSATALALVGLAGLEDRSTTALSGGQSQRLAIAGVLAMDPEVLLLDEATARLDPKGAASVRTVCDDLVARGRSVVSVEDDPHTARDADELWIMDQGRLTVVDPMVLADPQACQQWGLRPLPMAQVLGELARRLPDHHLPSRVEDRVDVVTLCRGADLTTSTDRCDAAEHRVLATLSDVHFAYHCDRPVLRGIDLEIRCHEILALVGANGMGKTTLVKLLNALLVPTHGRVLVNGVDTARATTAELSGTVGFCFQIPAHQLFHRRVDHEVGFGLRVRGAGRDVVAAEVAGVLERLGISHLARENPLGLDPADQQLVALASALVTSPRILVVDEPTASADWAQTQRIMEVLHTEADRGVGVVMISHDEELLAWHADRVVRLADGMVVADGTPAEVLDAEPFALWHQLGDPAVVRDAVEVCDRIAAGLRRWDAH